MRPDRIVVGERRSAEAFDMLQNSGIAYIRYLCSYSIWLGKHVTCRIFEGAISCERWSLLLFLHTLAYTWDETQTGKRQKTKT